MTEVGLSNTRTQRKAFQYILISQTLVKLADNLMNAKVTLPWVLSALGAPASFITWLVPIRESGSLIPQLFISGSVQKLQFRKWAWLLGTLVQAVAIAVIGLVVWFGNGYHAGLAILLLLSIFSVGKSLSSLSSKDVIAKTTAKRWRGKLGGFSDSAGGIVIIGLALALILAPTVSPSARAYAVAFWLSSACIFLACVSYSLIQEPASDVDNSKASLFFIRLRQCLADADFRRFLWVRSLLLSSSLSAPFFIILSHANGQNSLLNLGSFLLANSVALVIAGPFWGHFSDLSSRKVMIAAALMTAFVGGTTFALATWQIDLLTHPISMPLLYLVLTISHQGVRLGRQTYIINMAEGNKRTDYVAISNTLIGIIMLILGSAGLLLNVLSAQTIILLFSIPALAGAICAALLKETEQ